jgi:UDP-N-acetylmuramate--alanine ligase
MNKLKKYHFIGIGGIGMSALARILLDKEIPVSGSDLTRSDTTEQLTCKGATIYKGHSANHISAEDIVVFNSQIQKSNPEYEAALSLKCPIMHRSELLAHLMRGSQTLAVAGAHGKTTTSSLLATALIEGGFDPTFAVGGMIAGLNGKLGKGGFFVAEADESDGTFLNYYPDGAIITNIASEHLDHYKTEEALQQAFATFFSHIKEERLLFYCGDDPLLSTLAKGRGISYGFEKKNTLKIENYRQEGWSSLFDLHFENKLYPDVKVALIGEHNALNAAAVFGLSLHLGAAVEKIRAALENFPGVGRRCEKRGEVGSVLFLDDYGHHPTEIGKTLAAVKKAIQGRRLVVVFQPHRYTRIRNLLHKFCTAFEMADLLYVTDIYAALEQPIPGIDARLLVENIQKTSTVPCTYLPKERWCEELKTALQPHDVLLTLGAGDITRLHADLIREFCPRKLTLGLIFGGRSCEHEISVRSSRFVAASLSHDLYSVRFFGIDKEGRWVIGKEAEELLFSQPVMTSKNALPLLDPHVAAELEKCDLFLPILHGTYGEDGTLQGFFEMLDKPYIGPDYRSAAICMDKVLTKRLVESKGVKTPRDLSFGHLQWLEKKKELLKKIAEDLPLPLYVKPVHLGSSVGITRVCEREKVEAAIDLAFRYDTQVIVEEGKVGCRELEFAVLGNAHSFPIRAPAPGEKLAEGAFVDYEKKYGQRAVETTLDPQMPPEILEKGKSLARKAYEAVGCSGMARVDFLLDPQGEFWLFEMNPIPGLQKLSLFPKIWNREGLAPEHLFDHLIILALERHRKHKRHYRCLNS